MSIYLCSLSDTLSDALWLLSITVAGGALPALILVMVLRGAPNMTDDPRPKEVHMNLFARANAGLNLNPLERAALKLGKSLLMAAGVSVIPIVLPLISGANPDWRGALHTALITGLMAVLAGLDKYFKAQGDSPLAMVADQIDTALETRLSSALGLPAPIDGAE